MFKNNWLNSNKFPISVLSLYGIQIVELYKRILSHGLNWLNFQI